MQLYEINFGDMKVQFVHMYCYTAHGFKCIINECYEEWRNNSYESEGIGFKEACLKLYFEEYMKKRGFKPIESVTNIEYMRKKL